jgi:hypothetical protein
MLCTTFERLSPSPPLELCSHSLTTSICVIMALLCAQDGAAAFSLPLQFRSPSLSSLQPIRFLSLSWFFLLLFSQCALPLPSLSLAVMRGCFGRLYDSCIALHKERICSRRILLLSLIRCYAFSRFRFIGTLCFAFGTRNNPLGRSFVLIHL